MILAFINTIYPIAYIQKPEKFRSFRFDPVTSRYQCDAQTNWAMKPLMLGAGHLWVLISPWGMNVKWYMKYFIYWTDVKSCKPWGLLARIIAYMISHLQFNVWNTSYITSHCHLSFCLIPNFLLSISHQCSITVSLQTKSLNCEKKKAFDSVRPRSLEASSNSFVDCSEDKCQPDLRPQLKRLHLLQNSRNTVSMLMIFAVI